MKILITTDVYNSIVNGVAVSVNNLYKTLKESGHDVRILTLSNSRYSYIEDNIYYIESVPIKIYPDARATIAFNDPILQDIIAWSPEIIHSQCEFFTFIFARKLARHLNIPIVHTYHTLYEYYTHYFCPNKNLGKRIVAIGSKYICDHAQSVIAPTIKTENILRNYNISTPISVIPTGLDLSRFQKDLSDDDKKALRTQYGIPDDAIVLITLGRLAKEKNVDFLIEQMRLIKVSDSSESNHTGNIRYDKIHLVIAGDGPDRVRLESLVNKYDLNQNVHFTGLIPPSEVYRYYKLGNVFVSASNSETQGLTYIEAMACGLPILCLKDDCLSAILQPDYNGWFFTDQQSFCGHLAYICKHPDKLMTLKNNAQNTADQYSSKTFGQNVVQLYKEIIVKYHAFPILHVFNPMAFIHTERS